MKLIDKLPKILPFSKNEQESEYFFALNIEPHKVEGVVWGINGKKIEIVNSAQAPYKTHEELIDTANYALDEALGDFHPEPEKTLFGVPDFWLQDDNLKPEYLKLLKRIVKELGVEPMAYVSETHALSHYLQRQQGIPATTIIVEIDDPLIVSVVKGGKIIGTKQQKRTANLPEDIEKALHTFTDIEVLPSKILIYGEGKLDKYKDELSSFAWMAQLPFLHLPKIEQLDEQAIMKAVCLAGASEINPDVNYQPQDIMFYGPMEAVSPVHTKQGKDLIDEVHDGNVGFVEGDIRDYEPYVEHGREDDMDGRYPVPASRDHKGIQKQPLPEEYYEESYSSNSLIERVKALALAPFGLIGLGGSASSTAAGFPKKFIILPVVLLAVLAIAAIFLMKAKVTIYVDMRVLEKDAQITADPGISEVNEAINKIPARVVETEVNGTAKGDATGRKKIGDPAKGTVVVYNKTAGPKTLSAGTTLVGPNNLTFTLDSNVNVASQSAVEGGISFGKATANVTATAIGAEGNISAGQELTLKGLSSSELSAKVDQAFSGGVSKDVTVVSADDQKKLLTSLTADLRKKAQEDIQTKLTGDMKILEEALSSQVVKQTFSKNVGDTASDFTLNLSLRLKGSAYNDKDLKMIVSKLVETNVPEGFEFDLSRTETQAAVSKVEKDGKLVFLAKFRAMLMPKLNVDTIKKEIAGKTPEEAANTLRNTEYVVGSDFEVTPSLPGLLQRLPFLPQNIAVEVATK